MFTFEPHIECLLLLNFLGIADDLLKLRYVKPQERNKKRLTKVLSFMHASDTRQYLKRTALALRLIDHPQRICGQLGDSSEPLLVRLAKGTVSRVVSVDFFNIVSTMHMDPDLDHSSALVLLFAVAVELCLRFQQFQEWPFLAYKL